MKSYILVLIIAYAFTCPTQAQKPSIKLRQSFQSAEAKPEPAVVTYTKPKDKVSSYLVDAAFGISLPANPQQTVTAYLEYHRNTLIDEEVNTRQAGVSYELFTNNRFLSGDNRSINGSTSVITANAKFSDNKIKKVQSLQFSTEFTRLYAKGLVPGILPNAWNRISNQLAIEYFPSVGIEYEGRFKTEEKEQSGNILRGMAKLNFSLYPFSGLLQNSAELFFNSSYRHDIINSTVYTDNTHPSLETGVNYIIYRNGSRKASIGGSYNNIDDPALGKEKQNFWLVALKVKL